MFFTKTSKLESSRRDVWWVATSNGMFAFHRNALCKFEYLKKSFYTFFCYKAKEQEKTARKTIVEAQLFRKHLLPVCPNAGVPNLLSNPREETPAGRKA